jgi:lambda repressor-like predicted transcriptional regulator
MSTRIVNHVDCTNLKRLVAKGISLHEIHIETGCADNSLRKWLETGKCPKSANVACEALLRRQPQERNATQLWIVRVPSAKNEAARLIMRALGITFSVIPNEEA